MQKSLTIPIRKLDQPELSSPKDELVPVGMFDIFMSEALAGPEAGRIAAEIAQAYLHSLQKPAPRDDDDDDDEDEQPSIAEDADWQALPRRSGRQMSENARWVTVDDVTSGPLKPAVHPEACVVDQSGRGDADRTRAVLRVRADYVALLLSFLPARPIRPTHRTRRTGGEHRRRGSQSSRLVLQ